jgi:tetratricopeptide (TPR) repeat protein
MSNPTPAVDTQFFRELESLIGNGRPAAEEVVVFQRKAEALFNTPSPEYGWVGRALVASYAWDFEALKDLGRRASLAVGGEPVILANLAVALMQVHEHEESLQYSRLAFQRAPSHPFCVRQFAGGLMRLGRYAEALRTLNAHLALAGPAPDESLVHDAKLCAERIAICKEVGVGEPLLRSQFDEAYAVLRNALVRSNHDGMRTIEDPDTGARSACLRIFFHGDVEDELRLGSALATRLAALPGWDPTHLSVDFAYSREDADALA